MHEFEFKVRVRISDQIQTVKMAAGRRSLKFYLLNYEYSFALGNIAGNNTPKNNGARECEV